VTESHKQKQKGALKGRFLMSDLPFIFGSEF
jgi:hypothetical protein